MNLEINSPDSADEEGDWNFHRRDAESAEYKSFFDETSENSVSLRR
jgi:hypothetical protein